MTDAWKQMCDLEDKYTTKVVVRPDLKVEALACDRTVRLSLSYRIDSHGMRNWHSTTRNVITMRELAQAILVACDFVEESNPIWAAKK